MSNLKTMHVNDLINSYPLDTLKCFDRPKVIVMENLCRNSMYYRLLFNEKIYEEAFGEFLEMKTGVAFRAHVYPLNDFHKIIQTHLKNNIPILLCIDHLSEEMWKDFIPGEHEQHTLIVCDYDPQEKNYTLIDQDYSKDYFSVSNIKQRMVYDKRTISEEKLLMLASNAYQAFTEIDELDELHFLAYIPISRNGMQFCTWKAIEQDYKILIQNSLLRLPEYRKALYKGTEDIIRNFSDWMEIAKTDYDYEYIWLKYDGYSVPHEIGALFNRAISLKMYKVFFEYFAEDLSEWTGIVQLLNDVYSAYELCKNLFRKSVYTNNSEYCMKVYHKIDELTNLESIFYRKILSDNFTFAPLASGV